MNILKPEYPIKSTFRSNCGGEILIPHSRILMNWVIENIVKNAVDAMKGIGDLNMQISEKEIVFLLISKIMVPG